MTVFDRIDAQVARIAAVSSAGYFLALRIRGSAPLISFRTYPPAWTEAYMANGYLLRDPITTWAMTVGGSIRWTSPFLPDPFGIFRKAAEHGLRYGASVAHGPVRALSVCSFARGDRDLTDAEIAEVRAAVLALHDLTALPDSLTPGQRDVLAALADSAEPAGVARKLGIPRPEAQARIVALCETLLAATPAEALQRARDHRLI
jgi:LuxR family transcriptional regulator